MKHNRKQYIFFIIGIMILSLLALIPVRIQNTSFKLNEAIHLEAETYTSRNYEYELNPDGKTAKITGYTGTETEATIPSVIDGYEVTIIGEKLFYDNENVTKITIEEGITELESYAFLQSRAMEIILPESLTKIGNYAFSFCSSLKSIDIPKNVVEIGESPFARCTSLEAINVSAENESYTSIDGVFFDKAVTQLIQFPIKSNITEYIIPKTVTDIYASAFMDNETITIVVLPEKITEIKNFTFMHCKNLVNMYIPDGVTRIGNYAFCGCTNLVEIQIPETVTEIGMAAFYSCEGLTEIIIPTKVTELKKLVLSDCTELTSVVIPKNVLIIDEGLFGSYSTENITILCASNTVAQEFAEDKEIDYVTDDVYPEIIHSSEAEYLPRVEDENLKYIHLYFNGEEIAQNVYFDGSLAIPKLNSTGEYKIIAGDLVGNETIEEFELDFNPKLTVEFSTTEITNQDVTVTIISDKKIQEVEGWELSEDKLILTKIFRENEVEIIVVIDEYGNKTEQIINVDNIDKGIPNMYYITAEPEKTTYIAGQDFIEDGLEITAKHNDGTSEVITEYTILDGTNLKFGQNDVMIKINKNNVLKQPITVVQKVLERIEIIQEPYQRIYAQDKEFSRYGMKVLAYFDNGKSEIVRDYEVLDGKNLSINQETVTVRYSFDGNEAVAEQSITVEEKLIEKLEIVSEPNKTVYQSKEQFDTTGMIVKVTYTDGTEEVVTDYKVTNGNSLKGGQASVNIIYSKDGITLVQKQLITVSGVRINTGDTNKLNGISITKKPEKTTYTEGEDFDSSGMEVTATYANKEKTIVTDYRVIDGKNLQLGKDYVIVAYSEERVIRYLRIPIYVIPAPKEEKEDGENKDTEENESTEEDEENSEENTEKQEEESNTNEEKEQNQEQEEKPEIIKEIENVSDYAVVDYVLTNVKAKTPVSDFKEKLSDNNQYKVIVMNGSEEINTGYVATGMIVKLLDENDKEIELENGDLTVYEISVIGDVNGDGYANYKDTTIIKAYRNEVILLSDAEAKAADINGDGRVNFIDSKLLLYHRAEVEGYNLNY